jgi:pacifastin inhibitor LCMII
MAVCEGKACGEPCNPCAPAGCMSAIAYVCDPSQRCVPSAPGLCGCTYGGKTYPVGASYPAGDGCNECRCLDTGESACTLILCP